MTADSEDTLLAHRHDAVEAAAYRDMFAAAPPSLRAALGLEVREVPGATLLVAPGLPTPIFNRVIGLANDMAATQRDLDAIAQAYRGAGVRAWWIHAAPGPHRPGLCALLESNGYTVPARRAWASMWRGPNPPPEVVSATHIRRARAEDAEAIGAVLGGAFGMPPAAAPWLAALVERERWVAAVADLDGRVVGAGMLHRQDNVGWLGVGGVHPDARGTHVHRALMAWRIGEALRQGCQALSTETGEPAGDEPNPSLRNMAACGFLRVCSRPNFAAPAT